MEKACSIPHSLCLIVRFDVDKKLLVEAVKHSFNKPMTAKKFYDWQTAGGVNDVMRLVSALEQADISWCAIGAIAISGL